MWSASPNRKQCITSRSIFFFYIFGDKKAINGITEGRFKLIFDWMSWMWLLWPSPWNSSCQERRRETHFCECSMMNIQFVRLIMHYALPDRRPDLEDMQAWLQRLQNKNNNSKNMDESMNAIVYGINIYNDPYCSDPLPPIICYGFAVVLSSTPHFILQQTQLTTHTHTHTHTVHEYREGNQWVPTLDLFFFLCQLFHSFVSAESITLWCFSQMKVWARLCVCVCVCEGH